MNLTTDITGKKTYNLTFSSELFNLLEEAADNLAMGHIYVDTIEEAVVYIAAKYNREIGPLYEACFEEPTEEDAQEWNGFPLRPDHEHN